MSNPAAEEELYDSVERRDNSLGALMREPTQFTLPEARLDPFDDGQYYRLDEGFEGFHGR